MKTNRLEWGLDAAFAAVVGAGLLGIGLLSPVEPANASLAEPEPARPDPRATAAGILASDDVHPGLPEVRRIAFRRNETLVDVLVRAGADRLDAGGAVYQMAQLVNLRYSRPGDKVSAFLEFEAADAAPRLMGVVMTPEPGRQVLVARASDGGWRGHELLAETRVDVDRAAGEIRQSIYETAVAQGAGDQQVVDFAEIFSYDVDFQREIWPGDEFEILYEAVNDERGDRIRNGAVLFASLKGQTIKEKQFYRFTPSDDGVTDYFDESGQSAKKFLMRTPINGARLSSGFGNRRHPILGYTKLHKGTDFAAPRGTPIYAAGNGVIERSDRYGSYGNYIRIRHANGYKTAYAHLNGFAKGVRAGRRVKQGEVIGYVGTTGRSTGPHLHYEVYVNDKPVNAMSLKLPRGRKLEGDQLAAFEQERARIDALRLEAARRDAPPAVKPPEQLVASADFGLLGAEGLLADTEARGDFVLRLDAPATTN